MKLTDKEFQEKLERHCTEDVAQFVLDSLKWAVKDRCKNKSCG